MDSSLREQGSGAQQDPKRVLVSRSTMLAGFIKWKEEEQVEAGIYPGRLAGEQISAALNITLYTIHKPQRAVIISQ